MIHTPDELYASMRIRFTNEELVHHVLPGLEIGTRLRSDAKLLYVEASKTIQRWDAWRAPAINRVINNVPDSLWSKGSDLIDNAYYAGLQAWCGELLAIHLQIGSPSQLRWWCKTQFSVLTRYAEAFAVGRRWPVLKVGETQIFLVKEAMELLDLLLAGETTLAIQQLENMSDLPRTVRRLNVALPDERDCERTIRLAWKYMRDLGDCDQPEPLQVRNSIEVRAFLDHVVNWCNRPSGNDSIHGNGERHLNVLEVLDELDRALWADAAKDEATQGFKNAKHDELLRVIRDIVDEQLSGRNPHVQILQSRSDAGCDLLIEVDHPALKCGVQLKSWRDIEAEGFARNTLAQISESHRHGLRRLYVVFCADLTDRSQRDKVGQLASRISQANDSYVRIIPSERAWNLLFPVTNGQ